MRFIVITGTPGVGKTIASKILAKNLGAAYIDLNKMVLDERLDVGYDRERKCFIADFEKISKKIMKVMRELDGKIAIIEGHYAVFVVDSNKIDFVFVLRCHPEELETRLKKRGYSHGKISENLMVEILDICLHDSIKTCGENRVSQINGTEKSSVEIVTEIMGLLGGKTIKIEKVDWISDLEKKGKIKWFLDYSK